MNRNVRVNMLNTVNADQIEIDRFKGNNGDEYVKIKNVKWLINDSVLNGGLYPASENEKSYKSMEGMLMPYEHPTVNGKYVPISTQNNAISAEALAGHYIGAHSVNVRKSGEVYLKDIEINTRLAKAHNGGKEILSWVEKAESYLAGNGEKPSPFHLSTGLNLTRVPLEGNSRGKDYRWIATNMMWDHDAFVRNGAGGDEISLAVNGEEEVEVLTCNLDEAINHTTGAKSNWTAMRKLVSFFAKNEEMSYEQIIDKLYYALRERFKVDDMLPYPCAVYDNYVVFSFGDEYRKIAYRIDLSDNVVLEGDYELVKKEVEFKPIGSREEDAMNELLLNALKEAGVDVNGLDTDEKVLTAYNEMMSKKSKDKADDKDDDKKDKATNSEETPAWAQNLVSRLDQIESGIKANTDAALKQKRDVVMNKEGLSEDEVKSLSESVLNKMYEKHKPVNGLYSGQPQNNSSEQEDLVGDINALMEAK